jgi:hypothetical protein
VPVHYTGRKKYHYDKVLIDKWAFLTTVKLRISLEVVGWRREDFPLAKLDGLSLPAGVRILL